MGTAESSQQQERQLELHVQEEFGSEQQGVRPESVAALDRLAEVYETFEDTWDFVVKESAAGDMLLASEEDVADKLDAAQQQDDALEALEECRKNMDSASREFSNYGALHEAAWVDVKETGRGHSELKRKAEEAHTRTFLQRESIRRPTSNHVKAEEALNNGVGSMKSLRDAIDMIEEWHGLLQRGPSVSHPFCEYSEVVFCLNDSSNIPRPRWQCEQKEGHFCVK